MNSTITDFVFDKRKLSDFGYILCSFDNVSTETKPVSEIIFNTFKAPKLDRWVETSSKYDSPLSTTLQICKNPCKNEDFNISDKELSELSKWLCRKQYKQFRFLDCIYENIYFEAQIKLSKIILGNDIIGIELTIQTNRPYGLTEMHDLDIQAESNKIFGIIVDTDDEGRLYPDVVTVKCLENGNFSLINKFDNSETIVENCVTGEIITFDNNTLQIVSSVESHAIYNDFNYVYPHLCSKYEEYQNDFICNMNAEINIKYKGIRKVGI